MLPTQGKNSEYQVSNRVICPISVRTNSPEFFIKVLPRYLNLDLPCFFTHNMFNGMMIMIFLF